MKFKYLIILIAIGSLVALYFLSLISQPVLVPLSLLQTYNGQQVIVQGVVTDYRTITYGSQLITIRETQNSTKSVVLYIEGEIPIEYGDTIQATGEVQQYKNQWEIVVNNPQLIVILQKWHDLSFPLWQLALHPENYLDTTVNVTGIATQLFDSSFTLTSMDGKYSIEVAYQSSCPHQFLKGDTVAVGARFIYDATTCRFFLKATEATHGIWKRGG
jgi:cytochrome c-type biogenesis protein CcmE